MSDAAPKLLHMGRAACGNAHVWRTPIGLVSVMIVPDAKWRSHVGYDYVESPKCPECGEPWVEIDVEFGARGTKG